MYKIWDITAFKAGKAKICLNKKMARVSIYRTLAFTCVF